MEMMFPIRKISTYINAMIDAGFIIESMIEQTDEDAMQMTGEIDDKVGYVSVEDYEGSMIMQKCI